MKLGTYGQLSHLRINFSELMFRDSRQWRKSQKPWFLSNAVNAVILPKCRSFTFSQEHFVFNQHNLKFIVW